MGSVWLRDCYPAPALLPSLNLILKAPSSHLFLFRFNHALVLTRLLPRPWSRCEVHEETLAPTPAHQQARVLEWKWPVEV